jgi:two-component system, sensor histidine kinase LadS
VLERTKELGLANEEIKRMNELLKIDNSNLQVDIKKQAKDRIMLKPLNFEEFKKIYPDDESCSLYLEQLKWSTGYVCRKCNNDNYIKGKYDNSRRCSRCRYDESVTAHTIFFNQKFSLQKAFYMIFLILERREITEEELASLVEMRRPTCGDFKRKILAIIQGKKKIKNNQEGWGDLVLNPK